MVGLFVEIRIVVEKKISAREKYVYVEIMKGGAEESKSAHRYPLDEKKTRTTFLPDEMVIAVSYTKQELPSSTIYLCQPH